MGADYIQRYKKGVLKSLVMFKTIYIWKGMGAFSEMTRQGNLEQKKKAAIIGSIRPVL